MSPSLSRPNSFVRLRRLTFNCHWSFSITCVVSNVLISYVSLVAWSPQLWTNAMACLNSLQTWWLNLHCFHRSGFHLWKLSAGSPAMINHKSAFIFLYHGRLILKLFHSFTSTVMHFLSYFSGMLSKYAQWTHIHTLTISTPDLIFFHSLIMPLTDIYNFWVKNHGFDEFL